MKYIAEMTMEEKVELRDALDRSIAEEQLQRSEHKMAVAYEMIGILERVLGWAYDSRSRNRMGVIFRGIISETLYARGFSESQIGALIGKHHTTVHHYRYLPNEWRSLPRAFKEELRIYEQFNNMINETNN